MIKKFILFAILVSLLSLNCENHLSTSGEDNRKEFTPTEKQLLSSSNKFGLNLFNDINHTDSDKNVFISPLSVSLALGMTMNGANGETYDAVRSTLQFTDLSNEEINKSYKSLIQTLNTSDPKVTFTSANSIWYRDEMTFEQSFFDLAREYFSALVKGLNFIDPQSVDVINLWVKENTNDKIIKILEVINPEDVMFLINAIYFKGTWKYEFDKAATKPDEFNLPNGDKINTDFMVQTNDFNYLYSDDLQAIELPYGDGSFSMMVLLPREGLNINEFAENLNKEKLNLWISELSVKKGTLWLPKFQTEYKSGLIPYLTSLGMGVAFDPSEADFTNMHRDGGLFVNQVLHKTYIKVDEEGTEAAAVTSVGIGITSIGNEFLMKVNRPFIFIIKEKKSGCTLFIGKIINPQT